MNYYKRHLGDYAAATRHLSMTEHGAYTLLLDLYYVTERPLPADIGAVCRLVLARSKDERQAVEQILDEFFDLQDDGWHQTRCDEELVVRQEKAAKNRSVGKLGGRPRKTNTVSENNHDGFKEETEMVSENNPSHKPLASSHKKDKEAAAALPPRERVCEAPPAAPPVELEIPEPPEPPQAIPDEAPKRATQLAVLLRRNGADQRTLPNDRHIAAWVRDQVTDAELLLALETAKARRKDQSSDQPIGTAYLTPIIADLRTTGPEAASKPAAAAQDQWWRSNAGVDRKARELGLYARPTEDYASFKDRIFETIKRGDEPQGVQA